MLAKGDGVGIDCYYADKIGTLYDLMPASAITVEPDRLIVDGTVYPIIDDVIVPLHPAAYPESVRRRLRLREGASPGAGPPFAEDIQRTFGAEWRRFSGMLPDYEQGFAEYFDIVDLSTLAGKRVCDLGCGMGRWSLMLQDRCRELILVDFSDAIFVARENLRAASNALFFLVDLRQLPFRSHFADFLICLGVLHHLPTNALDEVRRLRKYADHLLIYIYYSLDNKPRYFQYILKLVTGARLQLCKIESPLFREAFTWIGAVGIYLPCVMLGRILRPFGLSRFVPLYAENHWVSLDHHRHSVYDRFFTRIEQRFSRTEILSLQDSFARVVISDNPGYWHFLCEGATGLPPAGHGAGDDDAMLKHTARQQSSGC